MSNLKRRNPLLERKLLTLSPSELPKVWDNGRKRTRKSYFYRDSDGKTRYRYETFHLEEGDTV